MKKNTQKSLSNFNKAVLSVVVLSAITGGLVLLEEYRTERSASQYTDQLTEYTLVETSQQTANENVTYLTQKQDDSLLTTDAQQLAAIAENNLLDDAVVDDTQMQTTEQHESHKLAAVNEQAIGSASSVDKIESNNVLFKLSSAKIAPEYKIQLLEVAEQIKAQNSDQKWQVIGHTDRSGRATYNLSLAKKRAQNVATFLIDHGVNAEQLSLVTLGEYEASSQIHQAYNHQLRRVQIKQYQPELDKLAMTIQKREEKIEARVKRQEKALQLAKKEAQTATSTAQLNEINHADKHGVVEVNTDLTLNELEQNTQVKSENAKLIKEPNESTKNNKKGASNKTTEIELIEGNEKTTSVENLSIKPLGQSLMSTKTYAV
ncbi:OmpA family protein [Psychromonas sp. RZ22]|uniref:OmpA family protein n=1 Tax=Psychromonas algarum TaxID=2555643 RepID=UPI0010683E34|nr:OmpA family protein [Psychromonas sp. RZ22]TEW55329.1 OmpA family protein [Psychromonas sp. RZ22]